MTTFKAISRLAADADVPYHTALAQGIRDNVLASREKRLRSMSKSYELRNSNTPRLCGTFAWNVQNKLVHTMLPFIHVRSRPDVTTLDVTIVGDQVAATGTVSAVVVSLETALNGTFEGLENVSSIDNGATAFPTVAADTEITFTGASALTLPPNNSDVFVVFIASKSALVGSLVEIKDSLAAVAIYQSTTGALRSQVGGAAIQYTFNSPHDETTQRPDFAVQVAQGTGKTNGWPSTDGPSLRQAIFIDDAGSFRGVYVYPPYNWNMANGVTGGAALVSNHLSYFDLKSVQIVETGIRDLPPSSALNAGKPASVEAHAALVSEAERLNMSYTPAFHCGGTVALDNDDYILSAAGDGALNKLHNYLIHSTTWTTIGSAPVRPHGAHKTYGGTQQTRVAYRVCAIFAIAGPAEIIAGTRANGYQDRVGGAPLYTLNVRLLLRDRDGTDSATGGAETFQNVRSNPHVVGMQTSLDKGSFEPVGYLLRAHHIDSIASTQKPDELLSHSLLGQWPEDVWASGSFIYFDGIIVDDVADESTPAAVPARLLSIQVKAESGYTAPASSDGTTVDAHVHLLSWTVVGADPGNPGRMSEVAI